MKRKEYKYTFEDLEQSKAIGIKIPFNNRGIFDQTYTTQNTLKSNLINFILTSTYERYLNPTFGTPVRDLIFDNINSGDIEQLKDTLRNKILTNFSNINLEEINIDADKNNTIYLQIKYNILNTDIQDELVLNFE